MSEDTTTTRWRATDPTYIPEQVECDELGWPNLDADGKPQFENTHYDTEAEAWASGRANVNAAVSIDSRMVREAERRLADAKGRLVASALLRHDFEQAAKASGSAS